METAVIIAEMLAYLAQKQLQRSQLLLGLFVGWQMLEVNSLEIFMFHRLGKRQSICHFLLVHFG